MQQSNPASGTTAQVRDALGGVALQASDLSTADTGTRWNLLDNLGSVAAQAVGGSVTQLADYDDFGGQSFATTGWNAVPGFGSEQSDPSYNLNSYFSRQYDPGTGSWLSQDSYRGLLSQPQSVNRYAFVTNNPATLSDVLGYRPYNPGDGTAKSFPVSDYTAPTAQVFTDIGNTVAKAVTGLTGGTSANNSDKPGYGTGEWLRPTTRSNGRPWEPGSTQKYFQVRHVEGETAKQSYGDSIAQQWNSSVAGIVPKWNETWDNFFFHNVQAEHDAQAWAWSPKTYGDAFGDWKKTEVTLGHLSTITGGAAIGSAFIPGADIASPVLSEISLVTSAGSSAIACTAGSGWGSNACSMGFTLTIVGAATFGYGTALGRVGLEVGGSQLPADLLVAGYGGLTW
ncbi:RHS repeat-associated core domain-containing protein [Agreia sp. COWG]|uniref:RHS repeat-associated core domain-containing protein n=1 Tax=Agreia sp. COWG TaxID=2773266 RepID=UPI0019294C10|nr:RHS repeat-associated core domain-containing protein [Agreia sp. COWG]CAD5989867.1 protein of unknown function [Agreia sp. COWG]